MIERLRFELPDTLRLALAALSVQVIEALLISSRYGEPSVKPASAIGPLGNDSSHILPPRRPGFDSVNLI